jgi:hypothetical protein
MSGLVTADDNACSVDCCTYTVPFSFYDEHVVPHKFGNCPTCKGGMIWITEGVAGRPVKCETCWGTGNVNKGGV